MERSILQLPQIYVNGGRRGFLLRLSPADVARVLGAHLVDAALKD
jgi:prolyl-tRNA editing enzyme YbaK/EbsC (Cys-tRNA(Pro) deacylase)